MATEDNPISRFGDKLKQFKPGESGNPKGRPSANATITDWYNIMADWEPDQIQAVLDDPRAKMAKLAAARCWRDARSERMTKVGVPIAGPELDRIMDRTGGKPTQSMDMTSQGKRISVVYTPQHRITESDGGNSGGTEGAASEPAQGNEGSEAV